MCAPLLRSSTINTRQGYNEAAGWNNKGYANQQQSRPYCDYYKMQGHTRARSRRDPDIQTAFVVVDLVTFRAIVHKSLIKLVGDLLNNTKLVIILLFPRARETNTHQLRCWAKR